LGHLREQEPLCRLKFADGSVGWLATSYSLGRKILGDGRFSVQGGSSPVGDPAHDGAVHRALVSTGLVPADFLGLDPPQHTRFRRLLAGHFTRRAVETLREPIEQVVLESSERMRGAGPPTDLVREFASPIGAGTQCLLLGLPTSMAKEFARISVAFFATTDPDEVHDTFSRLQAALRGEIEARRRDPGMTSSATSPRTRD